MLLKAMIKDCPVKLNWYILESALTPKVLILFLKMSIELHGSLAQEQA
jgi:hypothetical protein